MHNIFCVYLVRIIRFVIPQNKELNKNDFFLAQPNVTAQNGENVVPFYE